MTADTPFPHLRLSVVIPTLNEAASIETAIARLRDAGPCEILVADGGSTDDTLSRAATADRIISAPRGRGPQQNAGAAQAAGDVLLFLHADCWPVPEALAALRAALADSRCVGGCFRQVIDAPGPGFRGLERGNALRVRLLGWMYGDQGIFVRRSVFESLGGFADVPLMEDLILSKRLRRAGRIVLLPPLLHVSPRRWQRSGIVRQTLRNWMFVLLFHLGASPEWLAARYRPVR